MKLDRPTKNSFIDGIAAFHVYPVRLDLLFNLEVTVFFRSNMLFFSSVVIGLLAFSGCSRTDSRFVGTWVSAYSEANPGDIRSETVRAMELKADGTGTMYSWLFQQSKPFGRIWLTDLAEAPISWRGGSNLFIRDRSSNGNWTTTEIIEIDAEKFVVDDSPHPKVVWEKDPTVFDKIEKLRQRPQTNRPNPSHGN